MSPHDTDLATELRALRSAPRSEFTAELDARAAAGFPQHDGGGASPRRRFASWLERVPRRRLPAFAGAAATAAIAIATAVVAISEEGSDTPTALRPDAETHLAQPGNELRSERFSRSGAGVQYSATPPAVRRDSSRSSSGDSSGVQLGGAPEISAAAAEATPPSSGPFAARAARRNVERSARIVLATEASEVRSAAARVFETVHSYNGIVIRSSVRDGSSGQAGAVFSLLIPGGRLGDAMAAFSEIADVRSRSEATLDVTGPTIGLEERLRDARATVEGLLAELAAAGTSDEREAIEAKLRSERRRVASLRASLADLQRRTHFSQVSLRIESGAGIGGDAGGSWGVDDALDDAGRILTIAAGVTLIGLAVLAPLALLGVLAAIARRRWVRSRREQALS